MAFIGNFVAVQNSDLSGITFTDTSTGSDGNITERRIYPYKADGTLLLPSGNTTGWIDWPLPLGTALTVDLLPKDYSLNINVVWISSSPLPASTYDVTDLYGFTGYTNNFIYQKVQDIAAQPQILNDTEFYNSLSKMETEVSNCELSVDFGSIFNAQAALDRGYYLIINEALFF